MKDPRNMTDQELIREYQDSPHDADDPRVKAIVEEMGRRELDL